MTSEEKRNLKEDFLKAFPLESLPEMTLEKYTNLNRSDSFCYWIESKAAELGGVRGGSSFKFGIYKYNQLPREGIANLLMDDKYAWLSGFGDTAEKAFSTIRTAIVQIANAAASGDLDTIDSITTFGPVIKWKIAFLYSNDLIVPYYNSDRLKAIASEMNMENADRASIADIQKFLNAKRDGKDIYDYGEELDDIWKNYYNTHDSRKVWMWSGDKNTFLQDRLKAGNSVSNQMRDYSKYTTHKELTADYQKARGNTDVKIPDAYWKFMKEVSEGDIVVVFQNGSDEGKKKHILYGWGIFTSDLINEIESDNPLQRTVQWEKILDQSIMTDITSNSLFFHKTTADQATKLKALLGITKNAEGEEEPKTTMKKYETYTKLLTENHNLILTGAPGTGKTFMAMAIAEEMGAETDFVQFHPSYDYTDFVEGLRPLKKENGIGFERKDGIFKAFCKRAIISSLKNENNEWAKLNDDPQVWKVSLESTGDNPTRKDCLQNGYIRIGWGEYGEVEDFNEKEEYPFGGKTSLRAFQHEMKEGDLVISCYSATMTDAIGIITGDAEYNHDGGRYPRYRKVQWLLNDVRINTEPLIGKKMTPTTVYKLNVQPDKVLEFIKANKNSNTEKAAEDKKFVFIIDEINRGELSKILGELFFAIDPGYRGLKGKVKTQYQNLVEEDDLFAEGFYIPENVYILATMNDIDRSVESMDFAMRRRFTWKEVTPDDTEDMLDILGEPIATQAKVVMRRLNKEISSIDGLGAAFMVGPSYFLKLKQSGNNFKNLWKMNLEPLLKEYLRGFRKAGDELKKLHKAYDPSFEETPSEISAENPEEN